MHQHQTAKKAWRP